MYTSSVVIEDGSGYTIYSYGNGLAYKIVQYSTGKDVFIQGDDAKAFRDEYDDLKLDQCHYGTRASRFTWAEVLDQICGCYF